MKSLNEFKRNLDQESFDLDHETKMVQLRILSSILEVIDAKGLTQSNLEELTGLKQPFISALFNNRKNLNMEHIALFQHALQIVIQPPAHLSIDEHINAFYKESDYENSQGQIFEIVCNHSTKDILNAYTNVRRKGVYSGSDRSSQIVFIDSKFEEDKMKEDYTQKQYSY